MKNKAMVRKKQIIVIFLILFLILLFLFSFTVVKRIRNYYSVSDRTTNIKKTSSESYPVVGWLRVQGTNIDYPVLDYNSENYDSNSIDIDFAWTNNISSKLNQRTVIFGHNIRNVSNKPLINEKTFNNFENLPSFLYYDFVKKNKYIQYTINNKNYLYKIYGVYMMESSEINYDQGMSTNSKKLYINKVKKKSYFDFDVDVNSSDKLITLITCTRFFQNTSTTIAVEGRLLRNEESSSNYKVSKNVNYTNIESTMKGGDNNEKNA